MFYLTMNRFFHSFKKNGIVRNFCHINTKAVMNDDNNYHYSRFRGFNRGKHTIKAL